MNGGLTASPPPSPAAVCPPRIPSKHQQRCSSVLHWGFSSNVAAPQGSLDHSLSSSDLKCSRIGSVKFSRFSFRCNSSNSSGLPSSGKLIYFAGENETKSVLDAFFLGKALAEALNERIESTVGVFLSTIGRLQADQQKQVHDFQEEVLERAKKAKGKAAREAMEAQGLIPKSYAANISTASNGVATEITSPASNSSVLPSTPDPYPSTNKDRFRGVSNED